MFIIALRSSVHSDFALHTPHLHRQISCDDLCLQLPLPPSSSAVSGNAAGTESSAAMTCVGGSSAGKYL